MHRILIILAALASLSVGYHARADSAPQAAGCTLTGLSFADRDFNTLQQANAECQRLLTAVGDENTNDCTVVSFRDQNGRIVRRARLRVQNQVQGNGIVQALQQLQLLILNNGLLSDTALGLQIATQGTCQ